MRRAVALLVGVLCCAEAASAAGVDRAALATLTNLVTISLSEHARFEVLATSDVREVITLEAERQAIGCESDSSCLAEVAGAMGARFVVFGQLGKLETLYVLTLNLFDSEAATAAARVVTKGSSLEEVAEGVDGAVARLVMQALERTKSDAKLKVLVLDLKPASGSLPAASDAPSAASPPPPPLPPIEEGGSMPWLLVAGGSTAGLGALGLALGAGLAGIGSTVAEEAREARFQDDTIVKREEANLWGLGATASLLAGGGLLVIGGAIASLELVVGGEE